MPASESINQSIHDHQIGLAKRVWDYHDDVEFYHHFFQIFNDAFFVAQPLPIPAISVEPTRITTLGHYVPGRNGFGVCHNINMNARHAKKRTKLEKLTTLTHEMIHQWQELYGKPSKVGWYHNKEFCQMAAGIGIIAAKPRGYTTKITGRVAQDF